MPAHLLLYPILDIREAIPYPEVVHPTAELRIDQGNYPSVQSLWQKRRYAHAQKSYKIIVGSATDTSDCLLYDKYRGGCKTKIQGGERK
jgi:hypothetical protein